MNMKKYYFVSAIAALALASCANDDFLGEVPGNNPSAVNGKEISFSGEAGKMSRANKENADAATALSNKFVVFGTKTKDQTTTTVYDHYNVEYKNSTWDYQNLAFNSLNAKSSENTETKQSLKYWDLSADNYNFVAFSFGSATQGKNDNQVEASKVTNTNGYTYTLTGKITDLVNCYIADQVEAKPSAYASGKQKVSFTFHPLGTKVNIGLYEDIPGYSVKEVKFYRSANDANPRETPTLFANTATIPTGSEKETITVSFDNKKVKTEWKTASTTGTARQLATRGNEGTATNKATTITFENLSKVGAEGLEGGSSEYIGRDKTTNISKPTKPKAILPCGAVGELTLKVDYTLISTDGSGETIKVTGATAKIASDYTNWTANKSFTYIFKISDKTNGSTGGTGTAAGLYPIEFDSVIAEEGTTDNPNQDIELKGNGSN